MSELLKNIIRFVLFLLVQAFVLDKIPPLHKFIVPYLYFLFILWLPFNTPRFWLLAIGFLFGLSLDYFRVTPGLHAAPCVLIAYLRPFLINILMEKEVKEYNYVAPSITSMGWSQYAIYVLVLTFIHHAYLVFLEWMYFGNLWYFLGKVLATTGISFMLIMLVELVFQRKQKYRTNTA
jgi:hypothetical protein